MKDQCAICGNVIVTRRAKTFFKKMVRCGESVQDRWVAWWECTPCNKARVIADKLLESKQ